MRVEEEDLYKLGEALEGKASILQGVLNYDLNLETRDCLRKIEGLYDECLTDYKLGKLLLEENENPYEGLDSYATESSVVIEEDESSWIRLEKDKLGKKLKNTIDNHQENLENIDIQSGRERLEKAMTDYEVLAWRIPPSYNLSLEYVDLPPIERDDSEIMEQAHLIE
jgi:hypothetical protein